MTAFALELDIDKDLWDEDCQYLESIWRSAYKPPPVLTVSEWADEHRILSARAGNESGKWRTKRTPYLREIMDRLGPYDPSEIVVMMKGSQIGGPLCLNTPIPTPSGWTTMRDIKPGGQVFNDQGQPCRVVGVSPIFVNRGCYLITFDDGSTIRCDGAHLWTVDDTAPGHTGKRQGKGRPYPG